MGWLTVIVVPLVLLNAVCSENAEFDAVSTETFSNLTLPHSNYCTLAKRSTAELMFCAKGQSFPQDVFLILYYCSNCFNIYYYRRHLQA